MDELFYSMIFKRKSFHVFKEITPLTEEELLALEQELNHLKPLDSNIKIAFQVVPSKETTCKRGEYCILFYSEQTEYSLYQAGYLLEQLDLWLALHDIGACWYGVGEPNVQQLNGLDFVIMIAIGKVNSKSFRTDYTKCKRKPLEELWEGPYTSVGSVVRYAPSACNTQPWLVKEREHEFAIYRVSKTRGIMPKDKVFYFNQIDLGIFLLFLELTLTHEKIEFERSLYSPQDGATETLVAIYQISQKGVPMKSDKTIPFPLDQLHTTVLGEQRIQTNLQLGPTDVIQWSKTFIKDPNSSIVRVGKNWYVTLNGVELTINASSMTIITAHRKR